MEHCAFPDYSTCLFTYHRGKAVGFTDLEMNTVLQLSHICPANSLLILQWSHSQLYFKSRYSADSIQTLKANSKT